MSQPNGVSSANSTVMQPRGAKLTQNYIKSRGAGLHTLDRLNDVLLLQLLSHLGAQDLVALSAGPRGTTALQKHHDMWKAIVLQVHHRNNDTLLPFRAVTAVSHFKLHLLTAR